MNPMKELIELITKKSNKEYDAYAYQAGYYDSLLTHLAREIPEVAEYAARRVEYIKSQQGSLT